MYHSFSATRRDAAIESKKKGGGGGSKRTARAAAKKPSFQYKLHASQGSWRMRMAMGICKRKGGRELSSFPLDVRPSCKKFELRYQHQCGDN